MVTAMKLFTISGPMSNLDVVLGQVATREFQPESAMALMRDVRGISVFPLENPYTALLRQAEELAQRLGISIEPQEGEKASGSTEVPAYLNGLQARLDALLLRQNQLADQQENLAHFAEELDKLAGIHTRLEDLRSMRFARFRFGWLPRESYENAAAMLDARDDLFFIPTKTDGRRIFGIYFATLKAHDKVDSLFNSLHFVRLMLDEHAEGSAEEMLARITYEKAENESELAKISQTLSALGEQEAAPLRRLITALRRQNDTYDLRRFAAHSHDNFYLTGWVPAPAAGDMSRSLMAIPQVSVVIDEARDAEHITPPTKLGNPMFARSFEPFVAMFGLPKYGEMDPSLFMAITYTLLFGAMFGDLGQGLCLALAGILLHRVKKIWLGPIIACCGLSAAVFGCVYGSVFGFEHVLPGFKVIEDGNILRILQITLFAGVAALAFVMMLNIAGSLKRGDLHKGLFGANGIAGLVFYLSLVALVSNWFMDLGLPLGGPLFLLPCVVLPLACIFLAEPLSRAIGGKTPVFHEGIGGFLAVGLFELFETALSYLTNTLSFLRVGAYAIIHVGMMQVIFLLAGENPNPVVLVLGNIFVIGFEGLLVGIQVLRLEFYELFGRFYTAGGRPYTGRPI